MPSVSHPVTLSGSPMAKAKQTLSAKLVRVVSSFLDPAVLVHPFRLLHYWGYIHVKERRKITMGQAVRIAPNASFANGERIELGDRVQVGAFTSLWAGRTTSWIRIGDRTTFGPHCFVTAADYGLAAGQPIIEQDMVEQDVIIGKDCWIGTRSIIGRRGDPRRW